MPGLTVSAAERISNCSISVQKNNYHSEQEKKIKNQKQKKTTKQTTKTTKKRQNILRFINNNNININFASLLARVVRSLFELREIFLQASTLSLIFILFMVLLPCPAHM